MEGFLGIGCPLLLLIDLEQGEQQTLLERTTLQEVVEAVEAKLLYKLEKEEMPSGEEVAGEAQRDL